MKISLGQIFLDEQNYQFANEARIHGHWKNFSVTINIIIQHYRSLVESNEQKVLRIQQLMKENQELKQTVDAYRTQIVR